MRLSSPANKRVLFHTRERCALGQRPRSHAGFHPPTKPSVCDISRTKTRPKEAGGTNGLAHCLESVHTFVKRLCSFWSRGVGHRRWGVVLDHGQCGVSSLVCKHSALSQQCGGPGGTHFRARSNARTLRQKCAGSAGTLFFVQPDASARSLFARMRRRETRPK
jgi:hypothetical protein